MEDFEFYNPTRVVFGKGAVARLGALIRPLGGRVLLVTGGGSVKRTGVYARACESLAAAGITVLDLDGVRANPLVLRVRDGIALARESKPEVVVALGGGSVMDSAKAVAAGALLEEGDVWDFFTGERQVQAALPVVTVPTLAASGSEMNSYMVITNEARGHKLLADSQLLFPCLSVLDPTLTFTVPASYTAYGGFDAICHLIEPYFNSEIDTPLQDRMVEGLVRSLLEATGQAVAAPENYQARARLMWGATLGLCGITAAGIGAHRFPLHLIERAVSALFPVPHGAGLAALLPGWLRWWAREHPEQVARFGREVWLLPEDGKVEDGARRTIETFSKWLRGVGCPTSLADIGIGPGDYTALAENAQVQARIWEVAHLFPPETILEILDAAAPPKP